jgi:hypothetical protein
VDSEFSRFFYNLPGYLERTGVLDFVGAASSRDRFNSRLKAAPTGVFFSYLDLPDKCIDLYVRIKKQILRKRIEGKNYTRREPPFEDLRV